LSNTNLPGHEDCLDDGRCSCGVGREVVAIKDPPSLNGDPWNDAISNFLVMVGIDPFGGDDPYAASVVWGDAYYIYNGFAKELSVETVAQANSVTVFVRSITMYPFKHNDLYIDDIKLEEIASEDCWGKPRVQYDRTYVLIPQGYTAEWAEAAVRGGYAKRYTVGYSADDAGIGMLDNKTVLAVNPDEWGDLAGFYEQYYPKAKYVSLEAATPEILEQKLKGEPAPDDILLWQCDSRWKSRSFAGACNTCNLGCWITACAMAQRYYDIDEEATPITVDELLKSVGGYSGCNTTWTGMKSVLGIEVVKRTTDINEARQWLEGGNVCFAEVLPTSLQHFVMVDTPDWHMYDPYENKSCNLHDLYEGAESWRLIRKVQSPTPLFGSPIGLHLQSMVDGALEYIARVKPRAVKIFQLENAKAIKAANPKTLVVLRKFTGNQDVSGDLKKAAKNYIASFKDSLVTNSPWIDYVESYNELIATHDIEGIKRSVEFDCHFADELMALGLKVAPLLLTAAVGNPYHKDGEIELMLPAVRKAIQYNGVLGYHAYWYANPDEGGPDADWKYYAGRWTEWDKIFNTHDLYPRYIFGESGAVGAIRHPDGSLQLLPCDGWRSSMCCEADWNRYKQQLHRMAELIDEWNTTHNNRAIGYTIFTTGGWDWESFEFRKEQMEQL
jgi:hypothetical protein